MKKKLSGAALIVMSSIIISRLTGFIREMLVPNMIGVNEVGDAYNLAFRFTGLMYDLLVGGAIAAALIPILTGYIAKNKEEEGWDVISTFINTVLIAMTIVCILGMIFAPWIVPKFAMGFKTEFQKTLTIDLTRILFPSVAFLMMAGLLNGVLNSYQRFAAAAYGPVIYNVGCALSILFLSKSNLGVRAVAFGVMTSAIIYFLFQLAFAIKNLKFYKFKLYLKSQGFIRLIKLAVPSLISSSIVQINVIISGSFASLFAAGSVTALNMADRTWQMPYGVFAQGMGIAMLPTLSASLAEGKLAEYRDTLMKGIKTVLFLTIPSGIGFIVLNQSIIRTIFKFTNKFNEEAVSLAGGILMLFSIALVTQSVVTVMNRAFYAANDTKTPLYSGSVTIIINILLSYAFLKLTTLGVAGMALSYSLASAANAFLLVFILNKKMKILSSSRFLSFIIKSGASSVVMGIVLFLTNWLFDGISFTKFSQIVILTVQIFAGAAVYIYMALLLKSDEAVYVKNLLFKKIKSRTT